MHKFYIFSIIILINKIIYPIQILIFCYINFIAIIKTVKLNLTGYSIPLLQPPLILKVNKILVEFTYKHLKKNIFSKIQRFKYVGGH